MLSLGYENLAEGLVLSVECDSNASAGLKKLASVLGVLPTAIVASGGAWKSEATPRALSHYHREDVRKADYQTKAGECYRMAALAPGPADQATWLKLGC